MLRKKSFKNIRDYKLNMNQKNSILVVQLLSRVQLFVTPWTEARQASLSFTISHSLLKLMSIESVMHAIQPSHHLLLPSPPAPIPPSFRDFSNESTLHDLAKVLEFQL